MPNEMPSLSIVIPCYNEQENVPLFLERFAHVARQHPFELIVVNDGSTDKTARRIIEEIEQKKYHFARLVTYEKNKGYGGAIMTGLREAYGEVLSWTHADLQTDPRDVIAAYQTYVQLGDQQVVIKGKRINRPIEESLFTFGMSLLASVILRTSLWDINAQPKLFHRSFLPLLSNAPSDFSLDVYALYAAFHNHYRIHTLPVFFSKRLHGESKWAFSFTSKWKTILRTIVYIWKMKKHLPS